MSDNSRLGQMRSVTDQLAQRVVERACDLIVQTVDVNDLVQQLDVNALVEKIDVDALLSRVDVNRVINRVDLDAIAQHTDIGAVLVMSSGSVASGAVDIARDQGVALDRRIGAISRRGRDVNRPAGWIGVVGQYAGAASRFAAYAVDVIASWAAFTLALDGVVVAIKIITGRSVDWHLGSGIAVGVVFAVWELSYFGYCWAAGGRTPGMALLGLRVVGAGGAGLDPWRGVVRALAFPLSIIPCGLGFAGVLVQRDHRALHDLIAGTAVVYSGDVRSARLRLLARAAGKSTSSGSAETEAETEAET